MLSFGLNVGAGSLKAVLLDGNSVIRHIVLPHEGNVRQTLLNICAEYSVPHGTPTLVTGNEGRELFTVNSAVESLCIEEFLKRRELKVDAVVSIGGEDLVVYSISHEGRVNTGFSGSKCASGTGEFFKQQLARMDMVLDEVNSLDENARVLPLSTRCSVFMKSDATHRLNKREATKADIAMSLSNVMATKVVDFLRRARIEKGRVLLAGGSTKNKHLVRFLKEKMPDIQFLIPEEAEYLEALGAAFLAGKNGSPFPGSEALLGPHRVRFERYESLTRYLSRVKTFETAESPVIGGRDYILGIDGGSTTTKACLLDYETGEIAASHYGRTHGDPVTALKKCLEVLREKVRRDTGGEEITISLAATTGSSREILGVFVETPGVYNEIIAHATGTTYFDTEVDTIFEIGGQDAKYVYLMNGVPIDYAMNEACSAGTGSFLEESAQGDLNINDAALIGDIALRAEGPLKFGEHCSAFINSDIRKAIQQGANREDITAGIVTSIVSNYLNRVVGNRSIGKRVFLQGGVAKNKAVPLAFAMLLNKDILVPPSPELMGCFGVALLARQKHRDGLLEKGSYTLTEILSHDIVYERVFQCKSCENLCPIQVLSVAGHRHLFGGRCSKYTGSARSAGPAGTDYVARRNELLFQRCAPPPAETENGGRASVGIPLCLSTHLLYPLYAWFFRELGFRTVLSDEVSPRGTARAESTYCFPAEIAHGAVQNLLDKGTDHVLLPHHRDMISYQEDVHANFCPITQALPYYITKAFPDYPEDRFLPLIVSFKFGEPKAFEFFADTARRLGKGEKEARRAFDTALAKQKEYFHLAGELGQQALDQVRQEGQTSILLMGRPYNAFSRDANMEIPRKFTSRGFSVIPFDILPFEGEDIYRNMYWYFGQQNMKAAALLKDEPNLHACYISNFSCAPDSFLLHYLRWMMGTKPYLVLELDSHTADAGVDTRIEAFLDIIDGYNLYGSGRKEERFDNGLTFVNRPGEDIHIHHGPSGKDIPVKNNPSVVVLLSNMGDISTRLTAALIQENGVKTRALPVADSAAVQLARNFASGKECLPCHIVLGSVLTFLASPDYNPDLYYLVFVPETTGPCRTGQYAVFMTNVFRDLNVQNVTVFTLSADNSYGELGPGFSRSVWHAMVAADYLKDIHNTLRACAVNPEEALQIFDHHWQDLLSAVERNSKNLLPSVKSFGKALAKIPLRNPVKDAPKVLVVGEIYVRRDDFAVDELTDLFSRKGIITKISGVAEWIHYVDFVREYDLKKRLKLLPALRRPFSVELKKLFVFRIEKLWKHRVERIYEKALSPSRLLPEAPHDMKEIMLRTREEFLNLELNSEIAVSSGAAAVGMEHSYSGVVNISPFACLIGRVIEGIYTPWARAKGYPVISVEVDGNPLPPNTLKKLDIFILNVLRFRASPETSQLLEKRRPEGLKTETRESEKERSPVPG
ncbi:MAG: anhydro-N-acetylmuramic acid kinase [Spirochaetales bacterium]|nr:anhydro-N-acetylmuramic acid kinase [Spirochaetales bacterium]